ncbi:MAG: cation:proton antiporter [Alphaproteobacteria bacterium]
MTMFQIIAILITLTTVFSYLNYKLFKIDDTIWLMACSMFLSFAILGAKHFGIHSIEQWALDIVERVDFGKALLDCMLGFMLFAGALHVNLNNLARSKHSVGLLATVGVLFSTIMIGYMSFYLFAWLNIEMPFIYCMLFGALISPTDPIAVLSIMKKVGANKALETKVSCESLFNDGVGVVIFLVILGVATGHGEASFEHIATLFLEEAVGGIIYGLFLGYVVYKLLHNVETYEVEILLTLSLVAGGYALATAIHTSGPLAMVAAGLVIGNHGRAFAMSKKSRKHLDNFWRLVDHLLVSVLFVLIGLEMVALKGDVSYIKAGLIGIPLVLLARFIAVGSVIQVLKIWFTYQKRIIPVMTWGGLRGGLAVAMALSIPAGYERDVILTVTYCIVAFSIIVQGFTVERMIASMPKD